MISIRHLGHWLSKNYKMVGNDKERGAVRVFPAAPFLLYHFMAEILDYILWLI